MHMNIATQSTIYEDDVTTEYGALNQTCYDITFLSITLGQSVTSICPCISMVIYRIKRML